MAGYSGRGQSDYSQVMERGLGFIAQKISEARSSISGGDSNRAWRALLEGYDVFSKLSATEESAIEFARLYLEFGELFMQMKDVNRAERCFRLALVLNPESQAKEFIQGGQLAPKFDSPKAQAEQSPTSETITPKERSSQATERVPQIERKTMTEENKPASRTEARAPTAVSVAEDKKFSESDKSEMRLHILKTDIDEYSARRDEIIETIRMLNDEKTSLLREKEQIHNDIDLARKEYDTKFKKMIEDIKKKDDDIVKRRVEIETKEAAVAKKIADIEAREKGIAQALGQMKQREAELQAVEFEIDDKKAALASDLKEMNARKSEMEIKINDLRVTERRAQKVGMDSEMKTTEISQRVKEMDRRLVAAYQELDRVEARVAKFKADEERMLSMIKEIDQLGKELKEKRVEFERLQNGYNEVNRLITPRRKELLRLEDEAKKADEKLRKMREAMIEREVAVEKREHEVREREKKLERETARFQADGQAKDSELKEKGEKLDRIMKERDEAIASDLNDLKAKREALIEKERQLYKLQNDLKQKKEDLEELEARLKRRELDQPRKMSYDATFEGPSSDDEG